MSTKETQRSMPTCGQGVEGQNERSTSCKRAFQRNASVGDSQVSTSFFVTDGVSDPEEQLEIGIFDISRAHVMPRADRELSIEPLDEANAPGEGDVVGRLNRGMYGARDASDDWTRDWPSLPQSEG